MEKGREQKLAVAHLALTATNEIDAFGVANCYALISCSKSKGGHRDVARNVYVSSLYRKSVMVAEAWGLPFGILSAKYGLARSE